MPSRYKSWKAGAEKRLLASFDLIDAPMVGALLQIETDNVEGAVQALVCERAMIALVQDGKTVFPSCQFDARVCRIYDVVGTILKLRPESISDMMLAYWMMRTHVDFDGPPADQFGKDDAAVLAAFERYSEPTWHG